MRPPLDLSVELTDADGNRKLLAGDNTPAFDIPQGLQFSTKRGEGFSTASFSLARRVDRDWPDLNLYDGVVITTGANDVVWEGRISRLPRSIDTRHQIQVEAVGHVAALRDQRMSEVYVDRSLSGWGAASTERKAGLTANNWRQEDGQSTNDQADPALRLSFTGDWVAPFEPHAQLLYDTGSSARAQKVYYSRTVSSTISTADTNWVMEIRFDDADTFSSFEGFSYRTNASGYVTAVTAQRFLEAMLAYGATPSGTQDATYEAFLRKVAVYGDHGLPLIGDTDPKGVAASDVIRHIVRKYAPTLVAQDTVTNTTYPIPHLVFNGRVNPYDALLDINKFHLFELAVWEDRKLHFAPADLTDYVWEVRHDDPGVTISLQGDSAETLANGIEVEYDDVTTGRREVLLPADHVELRDEDPENPVNRHGLNVSTDITLSSPTTAAAALQLGRIALAEFNQAKAPGSITLSNHVRDRAGNWQPVSKVRAGDTIAVTSSTSLSDRPRMIVETGYDHGEAGQRRVTLGIDSTLLRLEALQERTSVALRAAGLV